MNFIKSARQLVANIAHVPDDEDEPKRWDRTSRTSKAWGALTRYPYLVAAAAFFCVAATLFFVPVLPSAHRSGWTLAAGLWAVTVAVAWWQARTRAFATLKQYHLNVLYTGRGIVPRLGKKSTIDDDRFVGFKILRRFSQGGLVTSFEQFRDRFSRNDIVNHKEKYHRAETDGSGDVIHGLLDNTTFEAEACENGIQLFDSISVTHAGTAAERHDSKVMETASTLPPVVDPRTSAEVQGAFLAEAQARKHSDRELQTVEDYLDRLEEYVDPAGQKLFERTLQTLNEVQQSTERDDQRRSQTDPTQNAN